MSLLLARRRGQQPPTPEPADEGGSILGWLQRRLQPRARPAPTVVLSLDGVDSWSEVADLVAHYGARIRLHPSTSASEVGWVVIKRHLQGVDSDTEWGWPEVVLSLDGVDSFSQVCIPAARIGPNQDDDLALILTLLQ